MIGVNREQIRVSCVCARVSVSEERHDTWLLDNSNIMNERHVETVLPTTPLFCLFLCVWFAFFSFSSSVCVKLGQFQDACCASFFFLFTALFCSCTATNYPFLSLCVKPRCVLFPSASPHLPTISIEMKDLRKTLFSPTVALRRHI